MGTTTSTVWYGREWDNKIIIINSEANREKKFPSLFLFLLVIVLFFFSLCVKSIRQSGKFSPAPPPFRTSLLLYLSLCPSLPLSLHLLLSLSHCLSYSPSLSLSLLCPSLSNLIFPSHSFLSIFIYRSLSLFLSLFFSLSVGTSVCSLSP